MKLLQNWSMTELALLWISLRKENNYSDKWSWLQQIWAKWNSVWFIKTFGCLPFWSFKQDHFLAWNYYTKLYQKMAINSMSNDSTIENTSTTTKEPTQGPIQDPDWHLGCRAWQQKLTAKSHYIFKALHPRHLW